MSGRLLWGPLFYFYYGELLTRRALPEIIHRRPSYQSTHLSRSITVARGRKAAFNKNNKCVRCPYKCTFRAEVTNFSSRIISNFNPLAFDTRFSFLLKSISSLAYISVLNPPVSRNKS